MQRPSLYVFLHDHSILVIPFLNLSRVSPGSSTVFAIYDNDLPDYLTTPVKSTVNDFCRWSAVPIMAGPEVNALYTLDICIS